MKLIIQIPAFNEEANLAQVLRELPKKLDGFTAIETLVIDDGSTDNTVEAARKAGASHILQLRTHRGLSSAFVAGIDAALRLGADVIVNTDADNQYAAADIAKLVAPIARGAADVVVGDREVARSPHMSPLKRTLQRIGSWTVGKASGLRVNDVTSGFRAFSREAAMQINVFNPFTYTLETVIQAGNRNLGVQSVPVRTNPPMRPSRLYRGVGTYLRKSVATIFRIYTLYSPLKTFFTIGSVLMFLGVAIGLRFMWYFVQGDRGGHIQSLILAAVFLITGFHTWLIALLADLIAVNRRLSEDVLVRIKRLESPESARSRRRVTAVSTQAPELPKRADEQPRPAAQPAQQPAQPAQQPQKPRRELPAAAGAKPETQWVWLLDEDKLENRGIRADTVKPETKIAPREDEDEDDDETLPATASPNGPRRRRRRRGGARQHTELPGNRGKHLAGGGDERGE